MATLVWKDATHFIQINLIEAQKRYDDCGDVVDKIFKKCDSRDRNETFKNNAHSFLKKRI